MTPERWQKIKNILDDAAGHPPDGRQEAVSQACSDDSALLRDVESFLELDDEVEDFIEEPLWTLNPAAEEGSASVADWVAGRRIGPYRVERPLGRGGMGTVFLATREDAYRQEVAVKVLSWGVGSEEVQARFYNERQILANLQHPGIARLLDGGTTDDGLPYLVMEYVEGERIDRYCEWHRLSIKDRLELFREVCAAVHFAHQNLVVHRDLKASNILVTEEGTPRLLDFGIAKLLEPQLAFQTVATIPGRSPMTPAYASPEQVLNDPITTACDVYALGVLLYRLLTGLPPYRLEGTSYAEMVRVICHNEPEKPSTVIQLDEAKLEQAPTHAEGVSASAKDESGAEAIVRRGKQKRLAGDLDAIVLKAMRKEPQHRYGSAAEMAEDIRRHLVGLPVEARKGSWLYYTTKYLRRNKLALAAILMILAFAVTTTVLWLEAEDERAQAVEARERAETEQRRAERIRDFVTDILKSAEPDQARGETVTVLEVLEQAEKRLDEDPDIEVGDRAEMTGTLSGVYREIGSLERAKRLGQETIRILRQANPGDHLELAIAINILAAILYDQEDYQGAEEKFKESLDMRRRLGQSDAENTNNLHNLASALMWQGRYDEAERLQLQLIDIREQLDGPESLGVAIHLYSLGTIQSFRGDYAQAEELLNRALTIRSRELDPESTQVASVLNTLGRVFLATKRYEESESSYSQALAIRIQRLGEDNLNVARTRTGLAALLLARNEIKAAGEMINLALEKLSENESENSYAVAQANNVWGGYLTASGRYEEAEPVLEASYETIRTQHGDASSLTRAARHRLVELYRAWDKPDKLQALTGVDNRIK